MANRFKIIISQAQVISKDICLVLVTTENFARDNRKALYFEKTQKRRN